LSSGEFKARIMAMASSVPGSVSMITRFGEDCAEELATSVRSVSEIKNCFKRRFPFPM
jgi:hypothetical protein